MVILGITFFLPSSSTSKQSWIWYMPIHFGSLGIVLPFLFGMIVGATTPFYLLLTLARLPREQLMLILLTSLLIMRSPFLLIWPLFFLEGCLNMTTIRPPSRNLDDQIVWKHSIPGALSLKDAYLFKDSTSLAWTRQRLFGLLISLFPNLYSYGD